MRYLALFIILVLIPITAFSTGTERLKNSTQPSYSTPNLSKKFPYWGFMYELRGGAPANSSKLYGENAVEIGINFKPDLYIGYQQQFGNNFQNNDQSLEDGPQVQNFDGYFTAQFKDLWKQKGSSLSLDQRLYVPTDNSLRDNGMVTRIRSNLTLRSQISKLYALRITGSPIFHIYSQTGGKNAEGKDHANPLFETRFVVSQEFALSKAVTLALPLRLMSIRHANYIATAEHNDQWTHTMTFYPEVTLAVSKSAAVGIAYETGNLVTSDLGGAQISEGFSSGIGHAFFQLSF